jgi:predicted O-methyltransferase YrrM
MANTTASPAFSRTIERMFADASRDDLSAEPELPSGRNAWADAAAAERFSAFSDYYLPISREAGSLLYVLARAIRPDTVVEFGTSFGISTMFLAAAVTDNGSGSVLTTELLEPRLAPGALVAADDITHSNMADYPRHVRDPDGGYVTTSFPVEDGIEVSSWTG